MSIEGLSQSYQQESLIKPISRVGGSDEYPVYKRADGHRIQELGGCATNEGIFVEGLDLTTGERVRERTLDFYYPSSEKPAI